MKKVLVLWDFYKWEKFATKVECIVHTLRVRHVQMVGCKGDYNKTDVKREP